MKKALVIFLALALVGSVFAAEPAAEVKVAEFKGDAAVTFGVNLDDGHTGFKNETSGSLKLNLLNGGDKSTTGDGVWGELKIKFDGITVEAKNDKASALNDKKVSIETAKIHFGPVYMGILEGDFDFGGDFYYPNALNYKDKDDHEKGSKFVRNPLPELGYNQGVVIGYEHDMFSVEASLRSKKETTKKLDKVESFFVSKDDEKAPEGGAWLNEEDAYNNDETGAGYEKKGNLLTQGRLYYKRVMKDDETDYWTNKYAMGVYGEVKPVKDLRVGVGFAYAMGELGPDAEKQSIDIKNDDGDRAKDMDLFVGADYRFNINDSFFLQPTLTYSMYNNYVWTKSDEGKYDANHLTAFGLRFGFAKSKSSDGNSQLYDFFGKNTLYYDKHAEDKGDDMLLPGVSVFTYVHGGDKIRTDFPVMLTFYSGEMVENLKVSALFGANVGPAASLMDKELDLSALGLGKVTFLAPFGPGSAKKSYQDLIDARGLQAGLAASYDVKVGDITIVPALGMLWTHGSVKGDVAALDKNASDNDKNFVASTKVVANQFRYAASVDVKGLVDNTTISLFWKDSAYGKAVANAVEGTKIGWPTDFEKDTYYTNKHGVFGVKAKISF